MNYIEAYYIAEIAQIRKIIGENMELRLCLLRELADELGLVSISDYCRITGVNRRTIQHKLQKERVNYFKISNKRYPLVNYPPTP